jgi:serine/threonine-protein kinase
MLAGKYRLGRRLGAGAAGTVFEAQNVAIQRRVAIKVLGPKHASSPDVVARFHREAQAAGRLGHDHIVEVLDLGTTDEGVPFLVMELLVGETLRALLHREGRLETPRAIDIALQILDVLDAAHRAGIVHRDLKPENLLLTRRGRRGDFVKVLDFGVAKFFDHGSAYETDQGSTVVGTPSYMSPEQVRGRELDARSDLFSLGVVLWEMLAGHLPHEGQGANDVMISIATRDAPPLVDVRPDVDTRLSVAIARALQREPAARTASAREMSIALEPFAAALEIEVSEPIVSLAPGAVAAPPADDSADAGVHADPDTEVEPDTHPRALPVEDIRRATTEIVQVPDLPLERRIGLRWGALAAVATVAAGIATVFSLGGGSQARVTASPLPPTSPMGTAEPPIITPPITPAPRIAPPAIDEAPPPAPPSAEPAPTSASDADEIRLEVDATVRGAVVRLDGEILGRTPLRTTVEARSRTAILEVEAPGRAPFQRSISLDGAPVRVRAALRSLESPGRGALDREGTLDPFVP